MLLLKYCQYFIMPPHPPEYLLYHSVQSWGRVGGVMAMQFFCFLLTAVVDFSFNIVCPCPPVSFWGQRGWMLERKLFPPCSHEGQREGCGDFCPSFQCMGNGPNCTNGSRGGMGRLCNLKNLLCLGMQAKSTYQSWNFIEKSSFSVVLLL